MARRFDEPGPREDVRSDLMRSRHRLSKLLLRQGIIYSGGQPWTGAHEHWLRGQRFTHPRLQRGVPDGGAPRTAPHDTDCSR